MRIANLFLGIALILTAVNVAAKQEKILLCHVGNETGPGGEVYLDDPDCVPNDLNNYFCPDAGKIDLIVVAKRAKHLNNPSHSWDGISDYEPSDVGASGKGTEDSDRDGVDDGCQPSGACPCWDEDELLSVTADNVIDYASCSAYAPGYPEVAVIQNDYTTPDVEGGFSAVSAAGDISCQTRDFPPYIDDNITVEEADACIAQIAQRCADIGDPIVN